MMQPLVSIVIPVYNEKKIIRAIESCLHQTYTNIEIIVVDDASEEDIKSLVLNFSDKRIHYECQSKRSNANVCRNIGIACAQGKYVCFLDSDDVLLKTHIAECIKILEETGCNSLYGSVIVHNGEYPVEYEVSHKLSDESMISYLLKKGYGACTSSLFMTKESAEDIGWDENLKRHQDYDFVVRYDKKYSFAVKTKPTVIYDANKSNKKNLKIDFNSCITCIEKYKAGIDKQVYKFYLKHMYLLAKQLNAEEEVMKYYSEELTQFPEEEKLIKCLKNQDYNFNYKVQIVNEIK